MTDTVIKSDKHTRRLWITTADIHRVTGVYVDGQRADHLRWARWVILWQRIGVQVLRGGTVTPPYRCLDANPRRARRRTMKEIAKALELAKHMRVAFAKRDATHLTAAEKREMGCSCTHEIGDSACDAHPSCASCGEINSDTLLIAEQLSRALIDVHAECERMRTALEAAKTALYDAMHAGNLSRAYHDCVIAKIEAAIDSARREGSK